MKLLILLIVVTFSLSALGKSGDFWMGRLTLTGDLQVYTGHSSTSPKLCKIKKGQSISEIKIGRTWMNVKTSCGIGYVSRRSVVRFDASVVLTAFEKMVFGDVRFFRIDGTLYVEAVGRCYTVPISLINAIISMPSGKDHIRTIVEHLTNIGGMKPLTQEAAAICFRQ